MKTKILVVATFATSLVLAGSAIANPKHKKAPASAPAASAVATGGKATVNSNIKSSNYVAGGNTSIGIKLSNSSLNLGF